MQNLQTKIAADNHLRQYAQRISKSINEIITVIYTQKFAILNIIYLSNFISSY